MKLKSRYFRPRYSLRLLLIGFLLVTAIVAVYRDPLRRRLEQLMTKGRKPVDTLVITGPPTVGVPVALDPPSPDEIMRAMKAAGEPDDLFVDIRMVVEQIADYVDPPMFSTAIGRSQLHHAHYKCMLYSANGDKTFYIDHNHQCVSAPFELAAHSDGLVGMHVERREPMDFGRHDSDVQK